jgi:hypothetical protein
VKTQFGFFLMALLDFLEKNEKKALVLFDCESIGNFFLAKKLLESQFMVGVSCPSITGMTKNEYLEMMEILGSRINLISGLLTVNYNPTVDAKRSAELLILGLYKMISKIRFSS